MKNNWKSQAMLMMTAMIWGCAFVAQSLGMNYIGPWTFNCVRSWIGGISLLCLMPLIDRLRGYQPLNQDKRKLLEGGIVCGIVLAAGSITQQFGIQYLSVGKAGFLAALYVVIVPVIGFFIGRVTGWQTAAAAVLALAGIYFLSISSASGFGIGDIYMIISSFFYALHIIVVDHYSARSDSVRLSCLQFFTAGIICTIPMLICEPWNTEALIQAAPAVLYAGVISSGLAYTLQIMGQKHTSPALASVLMSLESVFAAIAGFLFMHQVLSLRELTGCALVFLAVLLAQRDPA